MNDIIKHTIELEGGYVNDKADKGGETYKGISRVHWPEWGGWSIIDEYKQIGGEFHKLIDGNPEVQRMVYQFYYQNFMRPFDQIKHYAISEELFDTAVNMGVGTAAKFLQQALNLMNRNGDIYKDLKVDGDIGPATIAAYKKADTDVLLKVLNGLQFERYHSIVERDPKQERFFNGWMKRV